MQKLRVFLVAMLIFFTIAPTHAQDEAVREALFHEIENLLYSNRLSLGDIEITSGDLVAEIYERNGYTLNWTDVDQIDQLVQITTSAGNDGLDPADYNATEVTWVRDAMRRGEVFSPAERAAIDIGLTDSLIRVAYHVRFGKVNPYDLDPHWNFERSLRGADPAGVVLSIIGADSMADRLQELVPRDWMYRGLQAALAEYRGYVEAGGWPQVPAGATLRPGDADPRLEVLAKRLLVTGDLPAADATNLSFQTYGEVLQGAVKRFQARHKLDVDGIVGPSTIAAMNVTAEERVTQIEVNLERMRWLFDDIVDEFILVNIAGFEAYLIRGRDFAWQTRVVVGRDYRKTPVFRDVMKYVAFNPTWTVPYSIATKDILPQVKKDPGYFAERNFIVRDRDGNNVDPASVDWNSLSRGNFPYTLVQQPGPDNALGRVKFMFPNQYAVYLHDTPSKYLFDRAERMFSSGCIRVEKPFEFAELLLGPEWDQERIQAVLDSREITNVMLPEPLPVMLLYWTAGVDDDGNVFFVRDVYDRDGPIAAALDEPFRFALPTG